MKRMLLLLPLPLALLARTVAARCPNLVERLYSTALYPAIAAPASRLASLCPVPLLETLLLPYCVLLFALLFKKRFFATTAILGLTASIFLGGWGLNYLRAPLADTLGLTLAETEPEALSALCMRLIENADADRPEDAPDIEEILARVNPAMDAAAFSRGTWGAPKEAMTSSLLTRLMIEGFASPFTAEAIVNSEIPRFSLPYAACHEAAHLRGYAREADANLIAYLACTASDDPFFRYSGDMSALAYCLNALYGVDYEAWSACRAALPDALRRDLTLHAAFWADYRAGTAAQAGARLGDAYLRTVGQSEGGARAYGGVVDYLLALKDNISERRGS